MRVAIALVIAAMTGGILALALTSYHSSIASTYAPEEAVRIAVAAAEAEHPGQHFTAIGSSVSTSGDCAIVQVTNALAASMQRVDGHWTVRRFGTFDVDAVRGPSACP